jgi:Fic family protein
LTPMKIPSRPRPLTELLKQLLEPGSLQKLLQRGAHPPLEANYLHWDDLRYRTPPADLSREEWWLWLKMARMPKMRPIPLRDKNGAPFMFSTPDTVSHLLHEIDRGAGAIINAPDPITNPQTRDRYIIRSLVEEAITSSQLEGAATTRSVAKEMLRTGRTPRNKSERMILNNYLTMQRVREMKADRLTPELVFELHRTISENALDKPDAAGRFRRADEPIEVADQEGNVFHVPPSAEDLPARLEEMCKFANADTPDFFIHPVVRAIILHFWLAYDHPFVDGNGRTARALFYWSMLRQNYWLFEFISISQIILKAPVKYGTAFLHTETDENDLTYFLLHQMDVIQKGIQELHIYIQRKSDELTRCGPILEQMPDLNHRQKALLGHALRHPGFSYTIAGHRGRHGVVYDTARTDLLDLAGRGLLEKKKVRKEYVFRAPRDLQEKIKTRSGTATPSASTAGDET